MDIPNSFSRIDENAGLLLSIQQLGYRGVARFVAFWWEEDEDQLAWADSAGHIASGLADDGCWLCKIRPRLVSYNLGSAGCRARQVLIWDRDFDLLWIAFRQDGLKFLTGTRINHLWEMYP